MFLHKKSYVVISLITVLQKCLIFTQDQEMQVNGGCLNSGYTVWKIEKEQLVPVPGSLRAKHPTLSPVVNGVIYSSFCLEVPNFRIGPK